MERVHPMTKQSKNYASVKPPKNKCLFLYSLHFIKILFKHFIQGTTQLFRKIPVDLGNHIQKFVLMVVKEEIIKNEKMITIKNSNKLKI